MRYCPFCGAELLFDTASFCAECGKTLTACPQEEPKKETEKRRTVENPVSKPREKKLLKKVPSLTSNQPDNSGYDGYYDDIPTIDQGRLKEELNKELIKKIVVVSGTMLLIIVLCVVAMYFL